MAVHAGALSLEPESFGEQVHRAYRTQRAAFGSNYRDIAERITQVFPVSMQSLQRLEAQDSIPRQPRMRLVAYLALIAYGFEPEAFGLNQDNTPVGFLDLEKVRLDLDPNIGCSMHVTAAHAPMIPTVSPGQSDIVTGSKGDEDTLAAVLQSAPAASKRTRARTTAAVTPKQTRRSRASKVA